MLDRLTISRIAFCGAAVLLALSPALWLIETWRDPAFESSGFLFFLAVAGCFVWSATSARVGVGAFAQDRLAIILLCCTAAVRLAGQVLAIDTISAFALAIDVYAIGRLFGLHRRVRAISPFWLAIAFAFCLPIERILQRCIGFGLQHISATGACGVLSAVFKDVTCAGVRIGVDGTDVLVDLPCSGSRALLVFGFLFAAIATLTRPRLGMATAGVVVALAAALIGNVLRITLLASGVALGPAQLGFDVMAQPAHDIVGLIAMGLASLPVFVWARTVRPGAPPVRAPRVTSMPKRKALSAFGGVAFLALALVVISTPHRPIDIAPRAVSIAAPERIGAFRASRTALTPREQAYFQQFGGAAAKASYGPFSLLVSRTTAPLRHLHAPDECMRGLGFSVEYLGMRFEPTPTALYRATSPEGRVYRVEVTFFSDRGKAVASVSEAVWIWLADRSTVWTAVQRISLENADNSARVAFDRGVFAALDLSHPILAAADAAQGGSHVR